MRRQFLKDGVVYGLSTLLSSGIGIFLVPLYTRALPPGDYGVVDYLNMIQVLVQFLVGLELTQGIARFYPEGKTLEEKRLYASTGLWYLLGAYSIFSVILLIFSGPLGVLILGKEELVSVFRAAIFSIFFRVIFYALQCQLRWELKAFRYLIGSFISVLFTTAFTVYFLFVEKRGAEGVFRAMSLGYGLGVLFCLIELRHTYSFRFDREKFLQMFRYSFPLVFSSLALFLGSYADRLFIKQWLGFRELGVYGIGAKFAAVIALITSGFQLGAAPLIFHHYKDPKTPRILAELLRLFVLVGFVMILGLSCFARELLSLITTNDYMDAQKVIPLLSLGILFSSLYVFVPGLSIQNKTKTFAGVSAVVAASSLLLNAFSIRPFGILGAAGASLLAGGLGFGLHAFNNQRTYPIPVDWRKLYAAGIILGGAIALNLWAIELSFIFRLGIFAMATILELLILTQKGELKKLMRILGRRSP